jgi:hypothetical protein
MPTRMALFVTAIFTIFLSAGFGTAQANYTADDCLAKPNATAPQGSHWYYRVDRMTRRECWYLGPEGKVRPPARQDASPARSHPSKVSPQPVGQTPTPTEVAVPEVPAKAVRVEIISGQAQTSEENPTAALFVPRSDLPTSTVSIDRRSELMAHKDATKQPVMKLEDEMPLIWPILTPADLPAAGRQPEFTVSFPQLGAFIAAVLGLAAIVGRMIFKFSVRRRNCSYSRDRRGSTGRTGKHGTPRFANTAAATRQANMARKAGKVPSPNDPMVDYESSVRRLLHDLQRLQPKNERRDSKQALREAAG